MPLPKPFPLGRTHAPPGALALLQRLHVDPSTLLRRHEDGDWGDLDDHDKAANNAATHDGTRIFSAYELQDSKVWVITEADRSATTVLLPEEY